jgi:hypothetical protein
MRPNFEGTLPMKARRVKFAAGPPAANELARRPAAGECSLANTRLIQSSAEGFLMAAFHHHFWNKSGKNSSRLRCQVCHSWTVPWDM